MRVLTLRTYVTLAFDLGVDVLDLAHEDAAEQICENGKTHRGIGEIADPGLFKVTYLLENTRQFFLHGLHPASHCKMFGSYF